MRKILFRALTDISSSEFYYGFPYQNNSLEWWLFTPKGQVKVIERTIGQFTGLLDKNGKEIFEGDLVKTVSEHPSAISVEWQEYSKGEITWLGSGLYVCEKEIGATELSIYSICDCCFSGLEIIGSIYQQTEK